ncbi:hypothetical protein KRMM14A1004_60180 [Krasilnikovia sp. MM14-A1004]
MPTAPLIVVIGTVPLTEVAELPIAGILIGGAMTRRRCPAGAVVRRAAQPLEAALSLGFPPRAEALEVCRPTAGQALDQMRTVGLVTLLGAFVSCPVAARPCRRARSS